MEKIMLILVLMGGPGTDPLSNRVAESIAEAGGARVKVVLGADAVAELEKRDLKDADLIANPTIGEQLTNHDPDLAVVRLERRNSGGDGVIESVVWAKGRTDRHVAIAGKNSDPTEGAVNGIMRMLGPVLPDEKSAATEGEDVKLAQLATKNEWQDLLDATLAIQAKSPRQFYYQILALCRLGKTTEAGGTLTAMRSAWPKHFLLASAEALVKPKEVPEEAPMTEDGNSLRDAAPVPDDGSNVLK
jgi:hypothetical protein